MAILVRVGCIHILAHVSLANIDWPPSVLGTRILQCVKQTDVLALKDFIS